jgi:peptide/nickel transport system substrate-binding protein
MKFYTLILLVCGMMACGSDTSDVNVFIYNQHNSITSLDPAFAKSQNNIWATHHLFSTLVQLDPDLNIQPSIAKSWEVDADALNYTFYLRDDVRFHSNDCLRQDDRIVNAADVVYSLSRLRDTTLNAPGSWIFDNKLDDPPFSVVDDTTMTIHLSQPFAPFLSLLTMQYCSIVPNECVEHFGDDFYRNPVGTGPFRFKRWDMSQGLFLLRNDGFFEWQDSSSYSNLDGVRTTFIGERSIAFLELINDRIDFFSGLESGYINTALSPSGKLREKYDEVNLVKAPFLNLEYMGMNPNAPGAHPLLQELEFRQALNYAIDRDLMLNSLRNGVGRPADAGVITKGLPAYNPELVKGYSHDIDRAKGLIGQFDTDQLEIPLVIHTTKDYLDLTTYIAKQWEYLGLSIEIEVMESATLRSAMRQGQIPMFRASWIADYPDGESFLSMFYGRNPAPPNYTRYQSDEFDQLYESALSISDPDLKVQAYQELDRMIVKDAPIIFLFYDEAAIFLDKSITGFEPNALNLLTVKNLSKQ